MIETLIIWAASASMPEKNGQESTGSNLNLSRKGEPKVLGCRCFGSSEDPRPATQSGIH